ncbi:preprotein translocase subunit SecE [Pedosphaera parvula]|uniref:Uncharacterized protein n=1 Tax=Pedosphaera parvula (strain Ellin514) TaxID=320771 RepID=B9XE37_PEDPL|nr:preprotein translocase subunit SecE [Pedosphaera parvula]EEF61928.1 hypothetical protein Cflav_PD4591 [Pedosphaera parvula Ellin514]
MSELRRVKSGSALIAYSIAVIGAFLIVGGLVWVMISYTRPEPLGAERATERKKALTELRSANVDALSTYGWQDQARGVVRLPMMDKESGGPGRSMELALKLWQNPAAARSNLIARVEKATAPAPKAPEKPSQFE